MGGSGGFGISAPDCVQNKVMRVGERSGTDGYEHQYTWTVPNVGVLPSESIGKIIDQGVVNTYKHCAMRIRLNVTSDDYDRWNTFATSNAVQGTPFLITSEENVQMPCPSMFPYQPGWQTSTGTCWRNLTMAAATPMLGAVFQDRTWEFEIRQRPLTVKNRIHNLNVIGRRGNVVQTYPCSQYDFRPNELTMVQGEWLHPQWTGSDRNTANQAGQGTDQTDRSNIVQIQDFMKNSPVRFIDQTLFSTQYQAMRMAFADIAASSCKSLTELLTANANDEDMDEDVTNCGRLNPKSANYFDGDLQKMNVVGTFYYMSSRNNDFTNRSQKGIITVLPKTAVPLAQRPKSDFINYIPGDKYAISLGSMSGESGAGRLLATAAAMLL